VGSPAPLTLRATLPTAEQGVNGVGGRLQAVLLSMQSRTAAFVQSAVAYSESPAASRGVGAMAEELDPAHFSISDREDLKEVDHDSGRRFPGLVHFG
jgi:hypothetical protein